MFKKFIIALALIFALVMPAGAESARSINNFRDVTPESWYYPYVKRLYEDNIINGVSDSSYAPDQTVKTTEVAALITRYLGLENAARQRRELMIKNKSEGAGFWYSGYLQVLFELGILESQRFMLGASGGYVQIPEEAAELIDAPIKRMDMVKLIASSFEVRSGSTLKSRSMLPSELSGSGNEFITGGGYDWAVFDRIAWNKIADYQDIPEEYKIYFLKLVYNGIIGGNELGQVLPHNNLRRSELARIIAAVLYFDLRDGDLRELPEACIIKPGDYINSGADGSKILKKEKAEQILREQSKNISASVSGGGINIKVEQKNIVPMGFINEIYIYKYDGGFTSEAGRINCGTNTSEYLPRENNFIVAGGANPAGYVYLVLRDLSRNGEIAGAVMLNIGSDGALREAPVYYMP